MERIKLYSDWIIQTFRLVILSEYKLNLKIAWSLSKIQTDRALNES
jgi:hypothetical protein